MTEPVSCYYTENLPACKKDLIVFFGLSDFDLAQAILSYHNNSDEVISFKEILHSSAMSNRSNFDQDKTEIYIQAFSTLLRNDHKLTNKLQGGGDPQEIADCFISGIQPLFLGALVGDFKPKSFDDAKLELRKQFPLIKKTDHIAAYKTRYSSSTDPQHLYIEGKIAAQAVIPSMDSNLNDIEGCLNCGLSKHSSETCFKNCLHCPLGNHPTNIGHLSVSSKPEYCIKVRSPVLIKSQLNKRQFKFKVPQLCYRCFSWTSSQTTK